MAEQQHPRDRANLGEQHDGSNSQTVPTKMIGLWERKYIRFLKDNDDHYQHGDRTDTYGDRQTTEHVLWLQTASGFGDMRIPKSRFCSGGNGNNKRHQCTASSLAELSVGQLLQLAEADCFCGICILEENTLSREGRPKSNWIDFGIELSTLPWRQGGTISMDWLHDVILGSKHDSTVTSQRLPTLRQKEGTLVTDNQGVEWKIVSIGYREN